MACRCGVEVVQPWRTRGTVWSPASLVGGVLVLGFGILAIALGARAWVGWLVLGLLGVSVVAGLTVQAVRGHRGRCLLARGMWFGLTTPGAPLRLLPGSP